VRLLLERQSGAESCPADAELGRRVAARIGRDPFAAQAERAVDVRIERTGERFRAEIRLLDRDGRVVATREPLESTSSDCAALADAVVLAVALTIDPDAALSAPPSAPPPEPPPPAAPCPRLECPQQQCPSCPPPAPAPEPTRARAHLRALGALGVLPAPAPGLGLAFEIEAVPRLELGLSMLYLPEVETDDGALAFGLTAVELFACPVLLGEREAALLACAGFQAGSLHAVARGLRPIDPGDYPWLAVTLGPRGIVELLPPLSVELGASAAVPLIAHEFVVRGRPGSAHEPATIGLFAWLGVGISAP
jgi:hypothetical protein